MKAGTGVVNTRTIKIDNFGLIRRRSAGSPFDTKRSNSGSITTFDAEADPTIGTIYTRTDRCATSIQRVEDFNVFKIGFKYIRKYGACTKRVCSTGGRTLKCNAAHVHITKV